MKTKLSNMRLMLVIIFVFAFVLRFFMLGANPPSLNWDEASIGYNAYSVLQTGKDEYGNFLPLSFRSFDDFKPPVYVYLTVLSVAIFGLNEFAVRFPAAFIGLLSIPVVYFLTLELLSRWSPRHVKYIALLSAFFIAISPWHLQFSRAAFEGNVGLFFLILSLLCFLKAFKKPQLYILFALFFVISLYSYHSFRLINPLLFIVLTVLFYKKILLSKLFFVIATIIIVISAIPVYASFVNPQGTGARLSMVTIFSDDSLQKLAAQKTQIAKENGDFIGQVIYNRRVIFLPQMIKGYFDHLNFGFLFLYGDGGLHHHAYKMGMLYLVEFPLILLGIFMLIKRIDRRVLLLLILFILGPLPASITTGTPQPIRAIAMIPAFQIFSSIGLFCMFNLLRKWGRKGVIVAAVFTIAFVINIFYFLHSYFILTPVKYGYFWQFGNKQAIEYIKTHEENYERIIFTYYYDQPYIYYLFYNKVDPSWYQKNWNYSGNGEVARFYRKIGKYEFRNIDLKKDNTLSKTLLIGTPQETEGYVSVKDILFPDGRMAYRIISL